MKQGEKEINMDKEDIENLFGRFDALCDDFDCLVEILVRKKILDSNCLENDLYLMKQGGKDE